MKNEAISVSILCTLLYITNISCNFDPCSQPIGMENGIIHDSKITIVPETVNKSSIRLHSKQNPTAKIKSVTVDFGRIMTIKGFYFQCDDSSMFSVTLRYGINPSDDLNNKFGQIKYSEKDNTHKRIFRYTTSGGKFQQLLFKKDSFSLRYINLTIKNSNECFKFEMYGCADACSSVLKSSSLYQPNNVNNNGSISWCFSKSGKKTVYMSTSMTISGIHVQLEKKSVVKLNVKCKRNEEIQGNFNINTLATQNMTFWFPNNQTCDTVDFEDLSLRQKCITIIFIGCENGCMDHINVTSGQLKESSSYIENSLAYSGKNSFLYNMNGAWLRGDGNKIHTWVQVCFNNPVLVSAIAIQAQGFSNYEYVKTYIIGAGKDQSSLRNYTINKKEKIFSSGISGRYATFIVPFPETFVAKCIRINPIDVVTVATLRWGIVGCINPVKPVITKTSTNEWVCSSTSQPVWKLKNTTIISDEEIKINKTTQTDKAGYERKMSILTITDIIIWIKRNGYTLVYDASRENYILYARLTCFVDNYTDHTNFAVVFKLGTVGDVNNISVNATNTTALITWSLSSKESYSSVIFTSYITVICDKTTTAYKTMAKQITVKGLDPFRNYTVKIFAFDNFNTSQVAKSFEKRFKTEQGAPSAVTNLNASAITDTEIEITWGKPEEENGILSSYYIELPNVTTEKTFNNITHKRISSLKPFTNYTIKVQASTNKNKILGQPAITTLRTKEGKSSRPRNLSLMVTNNNSIIIRWDTPLNENGIIFKYAISFNGTKDYFESFKDDNSTFTNGKEKILTDLCPGTNYTFHVQAVNGAGKGKVETKSVKVPNGKPRRPPKIKTSEDLSTGYRMILRKIRPYTGPIMYYTITITSIHYNKSVNVTFDSLEKFEIIIRHGIELVTLGNTKLNLQLVGNFSFSYVAVVEDDGHITDDVLRGEPSTTIVVRRDLKVPDIISRTATSVTINIPEGPGDESYYVIIVVPGNANISDLKPTRLNVFTNLKTPYITGKFLTNESMKTFTVGDGKNYSSTGNNQEKRKEIPNVPLQLNTTYFIGTRAHVDEDTFYTGWLEVKPFTEQPNVKPPTKNNATMIIAVVAVVVVVGLVGALITVFAFVRRWRQSSLIKNYKVPITKINRNVPTIIVENTELEETGIDASNDKPCPKLTIHSNHPPIEINSLQYVWGDLKKDSHHNLSKEYKALNSGQLYEWTDALTAENKSKNRYANIVAYNHSRVRLVQPNSSGTDYVNASYIHGYSEDNLYIASQGPNAASVNDFWQMIWENNVSVIVMLTKLIETKKIKCEQYWPEKGTKTFGSYEVHLIVVDTFADFVVRRFSVNRSNDNKKRIIQQYHYVSWPDHGVPDFPSDLLSFHRKFRKDYPFENTAFPILVHCSAGVGRTGTFICIDNMLKLSKERNIVDVFNYVNFIRTRRIHMVQNEGQYMFIYHALFETLMCGNTSIEISQFTQENKKLNRPQQQESNKNGYQLQFELLNSINDELANEELTSGLQEINLPKNRSDILPRDLSRVILTSLAENETKDYINAVFVNGYKKKNAFIATQYPLENTVQDFWRMIQQMNVVTIVILKSMFEMDEIYESFWPDQNEISTYNNFTVTSKDENMTNNITIKTFSVTSNKEDLVTSFILFDKWTESNVPQNLNEIVDLFSVVEKTQGINDVSPIVVVCSDGACRCGEYIAMSILLTQLRMEESIDVFQTVRNIRVIRPEFIKSLEQYEMLYAIIQHFIESFSTYSNFS